MSIDLDKAHVIDQEGLAITDDDGVLLFYITSGEGPPFGTSSEKTLYFDLTSSNLWKSFGDDNSEWVCVDIGPKMFTRWSLGVLDDPDCASELDCGTLPAESYRSVIDFGEL